MNTKENYENSELIRFSSDGSKRETFRFGFRGVRPLGNTGHLLSNDRSSLSIIQLSGELVRRIDRQPDGNWLEDCDRVGIANSGDFAVVTTHVNSVPGLPNSVSLFSAKGDPIRTLAIADLRRFEGFDYDDPSVRALGT